MYSKVFSGDSRVKGYRDVMFPWKEIEQLVDTTVRKNDLVLFLRRFPAEKK